MQGSLWQQNPFLLLQHLVIKALFAMQVGRNSDPVRRVLQTLHAFGAPEVSCGLEAQGPPHKTTCQSLLPLHLPPGPHSSPTLPLGLCLALSLTTGRNPLCCAPSAACRAASRLCLLHEHEPSS